MSALRVDASARGRRAGRLARGTLALAFAATPCAAPGVENAGFATDLSSWDNLFARPVTWDALDASGSASSGSARVDNPLSGNGAAMLALTQCEVAIPNQSYRFGTQAQLLPATPAGVATEVIASYFLSADCSDAPLATYFGTGSTATTWVRITGFAPPHAQAGSIRVGIAISKGAGVDDTVSGRFDDVFLMPTPLFRDGFESP